MTTHYLLPEDTDKLLRSFICEEEKGQFKKGMLMEYLNRAVLHYIATQKGHSTHSQSIKENETRQLKEGLSKWLFTKYNYSSLQKISEKHLKEGIRAIEGIRDSRSVNNRIESLLVCGIKKVVEFSDEVKLIRYEFEPEIWQEALR